MNAKQQEFLEELVRDWMLNEFDEHESTDDPIAISKFVLWAWGNDIELELFDGVKRGDYVTSLTNVIFDAIEPCPGCEGDGRVEETGGHGISAWARAVPCACMFSKAPGTRFGWEAAP